MMTKNAGLNYSLTAANIMEVAQGARSSQAKEIKEISKVSENNTEEKMIFNAKESIQYKSGENSKMN